MVKSRGTCPKCGSDNITKERHQFGGETGDLTCLECGYTSTKNEFVANKDS